MPDSELSRQVSSDALVFWTDPLMWSCVMIVMIGHAARVFKVSEAVVWRVLLAELVLAAIGTIGLYISAELQGLGDLEKLLASVLMSLGGIHAVQRMVQVWNALKGGGLG